MKKSKRKICVVTGTRAEYGLLRSLLAKIQNHNKLELYLVVSGMHLLKDFGETVKLIREDGLKIYKEVKIFKQKQNLLDMSLSVAKAIEKFANVFYELKPDILLLVADRVETFSAAVAGFLLNIPIFHLCGGEKSGSIDESLRHALTRLAHIHLANTKESKNRLIKMGEEPWRVYNVGTIGFSKEELLKKTSSNIIADMLKLDLNKPIVVVLQHPVVDEVKFARFQIRQTLEAIKRFKEQTVIIYPNNDPGSKDIIEEIEKLRGLAFVRIVKNLKREDYLGLLEIASVLVGNSSSGIIEAPFFGLPVINIGTRQDLRERASNVFDVDYDSEEIFSCLQRLKKNGFRKIVSKKNPYKDLDTDGKILDLLLNIKLDDKLLKKRLTL